MFTIQADPKSRRRAVLRSTELILRRIRPLWFDEACATSARILCSLAVSNGMGQTPYQCGKTVSIKRATTPMVSAGNPNVQ